MEGFSFITGIVVTLIGLNLLGILKSPVVLDNYFQSSARKYAGTLGGVFFLGILFSFVKVPCTAPMLLVLLNKTFTSGTVNDLALACLQRRSIDTFYWGWPGWGLYFVQVNPFV